MYNLLLFPCVAEKTAENSVSIIFVIINNENFIQSHQSKQQNRHNSQQGHALLADVRSSKSSNFHNALKPARHYERYREAQHLPAFILREIQHLTPRACPRKDTKLCILSCSQPRGPAENQRSLHTSHIPTLPHFLGKHPWTPASHFNTISFTSAMPLPKFHWNLFRS